MPKTKNQQLTVHPRYHDWNRTKPKVTIIQWVEEKFETQYDKKLKVYRSAQPLIFKKLQGTQLTSADEEILAVKYLI